VPPHYDRLSSVHCPLRSLNPNIEVRNRFPFRPIRSRFFGFLTGSIALFAALRHERRQIEGRGVEKGWRQVSPHLLFSSLVVVEKAPYVDKAAKRKAEYEKSMALYNKKQSEEVEGEGSDKSKSEVEDEDGDEEFGVYGSCHCILSLNLLQEEEDEE
ncbi:hypothetical protein BHE74_00045834, partial [Ensete ventricosum]